MIKNEVIFNYGIENCKIYISILCGDETKQKIKNKILKYTKVCTDIQVYTINSVECFIVIPCDCKFILFKIMDIFLSDNSLLLKIGILSDKIKHITYNKLRKKQEILK